MLDSADKNEIGKILNSYHLTVPSYQRAYQWKVSEAEEFWEDLNNYFQENKSNPETKSSLFLGTFIFLDQGSSSFEIVDGQQRITSIFILLIAIKNRLKEFSLGHSTGQTKVIENILRYVDLASGKMVGTRLVPSESIKTLFEFIVADDWSGNFNDLKKKNLKLQIRRIQPIYDFFFSKIESIDPVDFTALLSAIYKTSVVQILIKEREDAFSIFERTNARGMDLEASDLLKNFLFSKLKNKEFNVESKWNEIHSNADGTTLRMLKYFYVSEYGYVSQSQLYKKIKSANNNPEDLLLKLTDFSNYYSVIRSGDENSLRVYLNEIGLNAISIDPDISYRIYSAIEGLRFIKITQIYPLIYSVIKSFVKNNLTDSESHRKTLQLFFRNLENYHFVNNLILDRVGNEVEKPYANFAEEFSRVEAKDFNVILKRFYEFLKSKIAPIDEFKARFSDLSYSDDSYKTLIYIFDRFYNYANTKDQKVTKEARVTIFSPNQTLKVLNMAMEHWHPQKLGAELENPEDVHNIGNLLIMSSKLNTMLGHATPKEKVQKIRANIDCTNEARNNSYLQTFIDQFLSSEEEWSSESIRANAEKMADLAYRNVWKFEPPL